MTKQTIRRGGVGVMVAALLVSTGLLLQAQLPPAVGSWTVIGSDANARTGAAAVTLQDGRTLIVGGLLADGTITDTVVMYDPVADLVTPMGSMLAPRVGHTATLLKDGRVLVAGGRTGASTDALSADLELLDVSTPALTSTIVGSLPEARTHHGAARLFDNTVLIVGGSGVDEAPVQTAVLFDPATGALSSAQPLTQSRVGASATTLIDGRVLIAGGHNGLVELNTAEIYDPFLPGPNALVETRLSVARSGHTAVLLPSNNGVLIAGGYSSGEVVKAADLFLPSQFPDPYSWSVGTFAQVNDMNVPRDGAAGVPAGDGYVRVAGGGSSDAEAYRFATIKTDKDDYAPGELAIITGSGWQPHEVVSLVFQEDPPVHDDYDLEVTADNEGKIYWDQWAPEEHDLNVRFYLTAQDSRSRAQITFTDSRTINSVTLNGASSVSVSSGASITAVVNATTTETGANARWRSTSWAIATTMPPSGALTTCVNHSNHDAVGSYTETFSITAPATAGTYNAYFQAHADDTCAGAGGGPSSILTKTNGVTVTSANIATTLALALPSPASVTFGSAGPVTLSATLTRTTGGAAVADANVNFTVDGVPVGTATTNGSGVASITTYNPSGLAAGPHTVQASFAGATISTVVYTASTSGTQSLTVGAAAPTITFGAAPTPTYGSNFTVSATTTNTDSTALVYGVVSGPCAFVSGSTFSTTGAGVCVVQANGIATANFTAASNTQSVTIVKATATINVPDYSVEYDAQPHQLTGTATGVGGADLASSFTFGAPVTNVPGGAITWSFDAGDNYNTANGSATVTITKATAAINVPDYSVEYDAQPHQLTGTATGVGGADLASSFTFGAPVTNVPGGAITWSFDAGDNYNTANGSATVTITKATAAINVPDYSVEYDAQPHQLTGTATGVGGTDLSSSFTFGAPVTNVPGGAITWSFDAGDNYNTANGSATVTITKATAAINVPDYSVEYDAQPHQLTGTATGVGGADLSSSFTFGAPVTNVPGGAITWSFNAGDNYNTANGSATVTITKATAAISVPDYSVEYDAQSHGLSGTATGVLGVDLSSSFTFGASVTNVPGGAITWSFDAGDNYNTANGSATVTITKATAAINVPDYSVEYDAQPHQLTGTATGVGGTDLSSSFTFGAPVTNVPGGAITWSFDAGDNYNTANGSATVTITKATAAINVPDYSVEYDAQPHQLTGTATGVGGADLSSSFTFGAPVTNVPGGAITWSFNAGDNYNTANGSATVTITKATAAISVPDYSVEYDAQSHGLSGTATGVGGVDLVSSLTFGAPVTNVPGGAITWSFNAGDNYNTANGSATVTITKATAAISVPDYSVEYDAQSHGLSGTATGVGGVDLVSSLIFGAPVTNVPGGAITWSFNAGDNYNTANGSATVTITKATAAISVPDYSVEYDAQSHGLSGTATGVGGVDLVSSLTFGAPVTNVPGGAITWSFNAGDNYNTANGSATVTITKATAAISVPDYSVEYDAQSHGLSGTATGVGGVDLVSSLTFGAPVTNVPGGAITWSFNAGDNYNTAAGSATVTITKADATVNVTGYTGVYDGNPHGATGTATGVGGVALSGLVLGNSFTNVPGGTATWTFTDTTGNYNNASASVAIVISQKPASVTPAAAGKIYGAVDPALTGALDGFLAADHVTATYTRTPGQPVSVYVISATLAPAAVLGNYAITYNTASFTISKATLTVTAENKTKLLNAANPTLTESYTGFVSGETLATSGVTGTPSLTTTAVTNSPVGTYPIAAAVGALVAANYQFTFVNGTLNVLYVWDGFLQPINDTAHDLVTMSKFKTGQTIPAKFDLKDVNGIIVQQTVNPTFNYAPVGASCGAAAPDTIDLVYPASTLPIYTLNGGHYQYNWSTKGVPSGLYRIFAKLNDGTTQSVDICLSK